MGSRNHADAQVQGRVLSFVEISMRIYGVPWMGAERQGRREPTKKN